MDEDFNPSNNPADPGANPLAGALEELIQGRRMSSEIAPPAGEIPPELKSLSGAQSAPCPDPGELALLLYQEAASLERNKVDALLIHVASCTACANNLRVLAADTSEEEEATLAGLACASAVGQQELAAELARSARKAASKSAARYYPWIGAGLAASLMMAVGMTQWWRAAHNPERLLAQAYTKERLFDLRMPGAGYAEVTPEIHLRGGSSGKESSKLHDAKASIEEHLKEAPAAAHWLQLEARSDILEEKFDAAIDVLDHLIASGPATASLLLDDASAYFQRGAATGSEEDRDRALESFRRADELAPADPVVLFNEAVAMEDRGQLMNAVETWNRYLRFERDADWQAEGRRRLSALEEKLNQLKSHQGRM